MLSVRFRIPWGVFGLISALSCWGASFGTVVPINGTVSDIALDERRNVVWAANLSAYRVEQVDIATRDPARSAECAHAAERCRDLPESPLPGGW